MQSMHVSKIFQKEICYRIFPKREIISHSEFENKERHIDRIEDNDKIKRFRNIILIILGIAI